MLVILRHWSAFDKSTFPIMRQFRTGMRRLSDPELPVIIVSFAQRKNPSCNELLLWMTALSCLGVAFQPHLDGLITLSAAFSIIMIMMGVASTGGNVPSLKRLARCSGSTSRLNEPAAPTGIDFMAYPLSWLVPHIAY
jgi:hypothetical protein